MGQGKNPTFRADFGKNRQVVLFLRDSFETKCDSVTSVTAFFAMIVLFTKKERVYRQEK